jgi:hypothetical protein
LLVLKSGILSAWSSLKNFLAARREKCLQKVGKFLDLLMNRKTKNTSAGRPTVDDQSLSSHRDSIVDMFSCWWGEVGWQLPRATTREKLWAALEPVREHPSRYHISRLLLDGSETATAEQIREKRKVNEEAIKEIYEAQARQRTCLDAVTLADMAKGQASPEQTKDVEVQLSRRKDELKEANAAYDAACAAQQAIATQLDRMEAGYAQGQLLMFIDRRFINGKYARTPLNFANAMAGLPYTQGVDFMGAWQSYGRCSKLSCPPHHRFQLFETVQSIWKKSGKSKLPMVEFFHQEVTALPRTVVLKTVDPLTKEEVRNRADNPIRSYLLDNWPIWSLAIKKSLESPIEPDRTPFFICANFTEVQRDPKTPVALVLGVTETKS